MIQKRNKQFMAIYAAYNIFDVILTEQNFANDRGVPTT